MQDNVLFAAISGNFALLPLISGLWGVFCTVIPQVVTTALGGEEGGRRGQQEGGAAGRREGEGERGGAERRG